MSKPIKQFIMKKYIKPIISLKNTDEDLLLTNSLPKGNEEVDGGDALGKEFDFGNDYLGRPSTVWDD